MLARILLLSTALLRNGFGTLLPLRCSQNAQKAKRIIGKGSHHANQRKSTACTGWSFNLLPCFHPAPPVVALSLLAANPTNAYAENLQPLRMKRAIKKYPRQKNQKALLRKTPHYLLKKRLKRPLKAPLGRSTTQLPKVRLNTRALKTTQATLQETPLFQITPKPTTDSKSLIDASNTGSSTEEHSNRNAKEFNTNEYVKNFKLTLEKWRYNQIVQSLEWRTY